MADYDPNNAKEWYSNNRAHYERLGDSVRTTLVSAITHAGIPFLSVTSRAKEVDSFVEKIGRKGYTDPKAEMTDLAGIRVIVYIESDADKVCELIKTMFNVHPDKSPDKSAELSRDRFGYRSVHLVCDLGKNRNHLPENKPYKDTFFEIQVRTVLQHAWAEIQHDRGYKFAGTLPAEQERRLNAQAAILESVDREFDRIAHELDTYAADVKTKVEAGQLDVEINTTSLLFYLSTVREKLQRFKLIAASADKYDSLIKELYNLSILKLANLDPYFSSEYLLALDACSTLEGSDTGFIRVALMYKDIDKYLEVSQRAWTQFPKNYFEILAARYPEKNIAALLEANSIKLIP